MNRGKVSSIRFKATQIEHMQHHESSGFLCSTSSKLGLPPYFV